MSDIFAQLKKEYLPKRKPNAHKGDFGHVAVVGGDYGMAGAVRMASEAALRAGAGLVTAVTQQEHALLLNLSCPELMTVGLKKDAMDLVKATERATVLAVGTGLGRLPWGEDLFKQSLKIKNPKVLDADALWFLAQEPIACDHWILTPHPKEAATLLDVDTKTVQADRDQAVKALQTKYKGVVVLKGHNTLICGEDKNIVNCSFGNPGMATGGMGDVLTGIIAGLVAQKVPLFPAACLGVFVHAQAGDACARLQGERGMLATDILTHLPQFIN